jgi:hypothetical protein
VALLRVVAEGGVTVVLVVVAVNLIMIEDGV